MNPYFRLNKLTIFNSRQSPSALNKEAQQKRPDILDSVASSSTVVPQLTILGTKSITALEARISPLCPFKFNSLSFLQN